MPVASSTTNSQTSSYQGNKAVIGNRYNTGYNQGLQYEPSGTVTSQVTNYMAQDNIPQPQQQPNTCNKIDNYVPPSVLMRYTPQSVPPTVQNTSVYPHAPQTQQIPCLCVPFLDSIAVNQVNMNCFPSQDITGKDLPEMNTVRFFFNLGIENYRAICQGGQYWSLMDLSQVMPNNAIDHQNGNVSYQFTAPPPPLPKALPALDNEVQTGENLNQNHYQPVYPSFQGEVFKPPNQVQPVTKGELTPASDKMSNQSEKGDDASVDCNDSGCDSDSISGSAHDDSFKENTEKEKTASSPTIDLKRNIDSFIAKTDDQIATDADSTTTEFQVPSITKPRPKRKYYMYGNHKLIKPVKDIPPRFLSLLAENSAARARCEGEPIIVPFLPPRYNNRYSNRSQYITANNSANAGTTFNPEAKCFVPGQTVVPVTNDPSIIACSTPNDPSIIACSGNVEIPSNVESSNTTNAAPKYIIPYPPPNAVYVRNSDSFQPSNCSNPCMNAVGVGCHKVTGDGSVYKSSMPSSSSTGAGQPCAQYGATMQSVYYANPGSYPALPQGCVTGPHGVPGISYSIS